MYEFIDTTEVSGGASLPSEAMRINGEYIENIIEGYRTLSVSGREALSPDVYSVTTGFRDGSRLQTKRYPERIITVQYQLIAKDSASFREAYNKLGRILDVENAELIFNDEDDKFFIGTPCIIGSVDPGKNAVVGEFEILCTDPFKYSVTEHEAQPWSGDNSSILIDYQGTYKAFPILEADFYSEEDVNADDTDGTLTGKGDCGYVAFFTEDEKIVQLGDPAEIDGNNEFAKSQTLVNQTFLSDTAWGTTAKKLWTVNSGLTLPVEATQTGSVAMAVAENQTQSATETSGTLLQVTSKASSPYINYTVSAKTTGRTANSVKVSIAITASLGKDNNYFGNGYKLVCSVYIGGSWHDVVLKNTSDYWRGRTAHTKNITVTVSGLAESTTSLSGIKFKATRPDGLGKTGVLSETACSNLPVSTFASAVAGKYYLTASSYGSGNAWHGASITRNIGADAAGDVGASSFTLTYQQKMCIGDELQDTLQIGGFHAYLFAADGKVVAGVRVVKNKAGKNASMMLFVNGVKVHQVGIDISYKNKYFGVGGVQSSTIIKSGNKLTFDIGGYKQSFTDDAIKNMKATKIMFMFENHGTSKSLSYNGLFTAKFVKNNCDTWNDIPNKFGASDVLEANCKDGTVYLNGVASPELGALGNDWEGFYLTPGLNQIGFAYSDWVEDEYAPQFKVRYREVFL